MVTNDKVYRYTTTGNDNQKEGTWSAGKRLLPPELVEEANINRKWLARPELDSNKNYRFWLTNLGRKRYEDTLLNTHRKYLPHVALEEKLRTELGLIAFEDENQVVELIENNL